jgi:membrane glycosyltransferase
LRHLFSALVWPLPVGWPLLLSIPTTVLTSKVGVGKAMRAHNYLLTSEETKSPGLAACQPAGQAATESCPLGLNSSEGLAGIYLLLN